MSNYTVLLVEDDHDIRVSVRMALETNGFNVLSAANGREAMRVLKKNHAKQPHLILVDLSMPLMDGQTFLKVKNDDAEFRDIPVMVLTAFRNLISQDIQHPILFKPLDYDILLSQVKSLLLPENSRSPVES